MHAATADERHLLTASLNNRVVSACMLQASGMDCKYDDGDIAVHAELHNSDEASPRRKRHWMRSGLLSRSIALLSTLIAAQWSPKPCFI